MMEMKKSASFFTFSQDVDYREAMEESKKAGYDGVEFVLTESDGQINMKTTDKEVSNLKKYATDLGLEISSVGAWNLWEYNLVSDDKSIAGHAKDIIKKQIDVSQICSADTILVVPGYVGTPFAPGIVRYDYAYQRAQEAISELAPYAEAAKVAIGIENVWNKFLLSPIEVKRFLNEINSPYVGAYFDVGNIIYIGYPDQWIQILGKKYIKKLHFCDCRADQCGLGMFVDLLEGDVDFVKVMHALRDIEYDDWIVVEFLPNYKTFPYQSIINARYSLETILSIK
jgi:L-ribulose-5-phosphate 3-epimerase